MDSNSALELAKDIYNCFDGVEEEDEGENPELKSTIMAKTKHFINKKKASAWIALLGLLSLPWWGRAWIYQELMMAKKARFCCGKEFASWPVVELAIQAAFYTVSGVENMINAMVPRPATISNSTPYVWPLSDYWPALHGLWMGRKIKMWADPNRDLTVEGRFTTTLSDAVCRWLQASQDRLCKHPHDKITPYWAWYPFPYQIGYCSQTVVQTTSSQSIRFISSSSKLLFTAPEASM